jgi:hypothetical protein
MQKLDWTKGSLSKEQKIFFFFVCLFGWLVVVWIFEHSKTEKHQVYFYYLKKYYRFYFRN